MPRCEPGCGEMGSCHPNILSRRDAAWLAKVVRAKTDQGDLRSNRLRRIIGQLEAAGNLEDRQVP